PDGSGERREALAARGGAADIPGGAGPGPRRRAPGCGDHAHGENRRCRGRQKETAGLRCRGLKEWDHERGHHWDFTGSSLLRFNKCHKKIMTG
ncbi:MAG TPA: hypothetical protein VLX29_02940, partial [Nitrospirota bacterium]|nr:hypothetical protein [Nitrospirota bacterium]